MTRETQMIREKKLALRKERKKDNQFKRFYLHKVRKYLIKMGVEESLVIVDWYELLLLLEQFTGISEGTKFERYKIAIEKAKIEELFLPKEVKPRKMIKPRKVKVLASNSRKDVLEAKIFYASHEWRKLRYQILLKYGKKCMCCGTTEGVFHVDHIKSLRKFWDLRLDHENMQVLCEVCNHGKGNWDDTDHRSPTSD